MILLKVNIKNFQINKSNPSLNPEVKEELWGGEFWEDGYLVRTVGDKVTKDIIRKYIRYHKEQEKFLKSS